ncbi:MAG: MoaD/ThiS family protein [Candidatus Hydrogenedentes bacterium]|nr:MoaD/ThiS family protein [Candidatus Hydrogenedentota bacterium]
MAAIRVSLPTHLKTLSHVDGEIVVEVDGAVTQRTVIDAVESKYPMLCGTIRDHVTKKRRPFIRFYACEEDLSNEDLDAPLPEAVVSGQETYFVIGAMAGG